MQPLILVRHGNTFEPSQTPTWVGARTDLPLTNEGEAQARAFAEMVKDQYGKLGGIITGPLKRTRRLAEILGEAVSNVFIVDERLSELDYGLWENKSSDQIRTEFGADVVEKWETEGVWPENMLFAPSPEKLHKNLGAFLTEQHKKLTSPNALPRVAVTSNGILRFIFKEVTGESPGKQAKVRTGAYCILEPTDKSWTITAWNKRPGE